MRSPARLALCLLPLLLAGCAHLPAPFHKTQSANALPLAPPLHSTHPISLAFIELPAELCFIPDVPIENMQEQTEPINPPIKHRRQPSKPDDITSAPESAPANPTVSAIGQLSSGDPASYRRQTEDSIASIERGLNGINRPLNDSEQRIAEHIREFLKQAKAALATGDVDGAHTLAAKAQVLLAELTQ